MRCEAPWRGFVLLSAAALVLSAALCGIVLETGTARRLSRLFVELLTLKVEIWNIVLWWI